MEYQGNMERVINCDAYKLFQDIVLSGDEWREQLVKIVGSDELEVIEHPNGFLKIRLRLFSDGSALRLHVWRPSSTANPHNHRWDFVSAILKGKLVEKLLLKSQSDRSEKYSVYKYSGKTLKKTKDVVYKSVMDSNLFLPGVTYFRGCQDIHVVENLKEESVSLVCTSPPVSSREVVVLSKCGTSALDGDMKVELQNIVNLISDI